MEDGLRTAAAIMVRPAARFAAGGHWVGRSCERTSSLARIAPFRSVVALLAVVTGVPIETLRLRLNTRAARTRSVSKMDRGGGCDLGGVGWLLSGSVTDYRERVFP